MSRGVRQLWSGRLIVLATLAFLAGGMAQVSTNYDDPHLGVLLVLGGIGLGVIGFWRAGAEFMLTRFAPLSDPPARWRWGAVVLGLAVVLALGLMITTDHTLSWMPGWPLDALQPILTTSLSYNGQLGLWLLGMGCLLVGLIPGPEWRAARSALRGAWAHNRREAACLLAVTLLGLGLRLLWLETDVPILLGDEAPFGAIARAIADGELQPVIFAQGHFSHPLLFYYCLSRFVLLFGRSFTAIRLFPALMGALTVPAVIWLGRELFDRRVGWIAGLFLATYPVHLHFSRLALNNIVDPFFVVIALAALVHGLRRGRRWGFVLTGLSLGLSQYFYAGSRLAPPLFVGLVVFWWLKYPSVLHMRRSALLGMLLAFLVATWPAHVILLAEGLPLTTRLSMTFQRVAFTEAGLASVIQQQFVPAFMAFIHTRDAYFFYGGETALLLPLAAIPFLAGIAYVIRHWMVAQAQSMLLMAWIMATAVFGGALLVLVPGYARYVIATPAIALVVALGLVRLVGLWQGAPSSLRWPVVWLLPLAVMNGLYYFGQHVNDLAAQFSETGWQIHDVGLRTANLGDGIIIHLVVEVDYPSHLGWVVDYMADPTTLVWHRKPVSSASEFVSLRRDAPHAFFVAPERQKALNLLRHLFPEGEVWPNAYNYPNARPLTLFWVPTGARSVLETPKIGRMRSAAVLYIAGLKPGGATPSAGGYDGPFFQETGRGSGHDQRADLR